LPITGGLTNLLLKRTVFRDTPDLNERPDWQILQNGWSALYLKPSILDAELVWFRSEGFQIAEMDCENFSSEKEFHAQLKVGLKFPDYYGRNMNALDDCLSDLTIKEPGFLMVYRHYDSLSADFAYTVLEEFANASRLHMLFGRKLITLIQVNDPHYSLPPVGGCPLIWNRRE
jgi:RNAse (barnase) inhibitor barstar